MALVGSLLPASASFFYLNKNMDAGKSFLPDVHLSLREIECRHIALGLYDLVTVDNVNFGRQGWQDHFDRQGDSVVSV